MKNKKTLNDILEDYQKIEMTIIDNEGEVNDNLEDLLELNKCELKDKLDGYENFVKYLDGQISYLKDMEAHYNKRRKILEKSIVRCKDSMVRALNFTDNLKVKTLNYNFSLCESESWSIDLENIDSTIKQQLIKKNLAELVFKPSISEIKSEYKELSDEKRPKWLLVEKKKYVRVS